MLCTQLVTLSDHSTSLQMLISRQLFVFVCSKFLIGIGVVSGPQDFPIGSVQ